MSRTMFLLVLACLFCGFTCTACAKVNEITDPAEAAKDPDFSIQGEYVGEGTWLGKEAKAGAQVIAEGKGEFHVVVTKGGLPGDGWQRGEPRVWMAGKRDGNTVKLMGMASAIEGIPLSGVNFAASGTIADDAMTIASDDGRTKLELKKTVRRSPTEGEKAPEGAAVLFDGSTAEKFDHGTLLPNKNLLSEATTKQGFGDYTLHLEFRTSYMPEARGQGRGNSGLYLHDCYEVQVLDSFGLEGENNECGGFYQLRKPDVNMCFPPLTWQTYDIKFTAPKYKDGKKVEKAKVEVRHNGVLIHPEFALEHATPGRQDEGPAPRPFYLQGHGNKVEYRNIWVKEGEAD